MDRGDQAYFAQRAAEEQAAAERATCAAAASAHRELSLRYALGVILPRPANASDDGRPIGQPRLANQAPTRPRRPAAKRRTA